MKILPATDIIDGKAVRLLRGDYNAVTVYHDSPLEVAKGFRMAGAEYLHAVDLDGAKSGKTDNIGVVRQLAQESGLKVEIGGGIRNMETIRTYIDAGVFRVILGTAAITDPEFLRAAVGEYGEKIAVGADIKDGKVAIKGWTELSQWSLDDFAENMQNIGVKTLICTDVSKDGAMQGTNREMYRDLSGKYNMDIVASGGISSIEDVAALAEMQLYGAILGKALYTGAIDLAEAIRISK